MADEKKNLRPSRYAPRFATAAPPVDMGESLTEQTEKDPETPSTTESKVTKTKEPDTVAAVETWKERVEKAGLKEEEALVILDRVMDDGFYEKEYTLLQGRAKITLRSRDPNHPLRVRDLLTTVADKSPYNVQQTIFRANLAGSISRFQTRKKDVRFPHPDYTKATAVEIEDMFSKRDAMVVPAIPEPCLDAVFRAVADFDNIMAAIFSPGSVEGF